MKKIISILILLLYIPLAYGQERIISGVVSDSSGPLPGASVVIKGTTNGTETDVDGKYEIKASKGDILVFSYIGMKTKERKVRRKNIINVTLIEDAEALEEVVVTAYGRIAKVSSKTKVNVMLSPRAIQKHKRQRKRIGGKNCKYCISAKKGPLYIVDGKQIDQKYQKLISRLDKSEIKKMEVLKPNKAQERYGKLAVNGCIIITTKRGNYNIENSDSYAQIVENQFENVMYSPLSTFSIDVDRAAYSNIRRMINNGEDIEKDAVKIEEMINYFDYDYPQPTGKDPFSINAEVVQTPWNKNTKLVRIGLQGKEYKNEELPASNLTFLLDVSGSMGEANKLPLLKKAFKLLVNQLREKDRVSIVVYAGAAGVVLEPTPGDEKGKILEALNNLEAGGSTAGGEGIELAYKLAEKYFKKNGNNRVILATDGDFNVGRSSNKAMKKLIEEKRKSGVFLSVLGFGYGNYKDDKLELLADKGNGNHAYIDTMQEAQKVFGKEFGGTLHTIAKDVKIQVEFNPNKVQAYRLIGYENRLLNDEDFEDDTKDAGELGSGHTVTALYEIIPVGVESQYLRRIPKLKYTKNTKLEAYDDELLTVKFRYKKPNGNKSKELVKAVKDTIETPSADMSFVSAVALFGMHLRDSEFKNQSTLEDAIALANKGKINNDNEGYRREFVRLINSYIK